VILRIVGMMALASVLAGCASLVQMAVSKGINIGRTLPADRSLYNVLDDLSIKNTINNALLDEALLLDVNTDVYQGMVMLTGSVKDAATRKKAEDLTRKVDGVRELYNEIKVTDKIWLKSLPKDTWIENTLAARMMLAPGVRAVNYQLRVANGVVYLLGIAKSRTELDRVIALARTSGAHQIVSHVFLSEAVVLDIDEMKVQPNGKRPKKKPVPR
jgi:osmotically-inducible protein OsmY